MRAWSCNITGTPTIWRRTTLVGPLLPPNSCRTTCVTCTLVGGLKNHHSFPFGPRTRAPPPCSILCGPRWCTGASNLRERPELSCEAPFSCGWMSSHRGPPECSHSQGAMRTERSPVRCRCCAVVSRCLRSDVEKSRRFGRVGFNKGEKSSLGRLPARSCGCSRFCYRRSSVMSSSRMKTHIVPLSLATVKSKPRRVRHRPRWIEYR